MEIDASTFERDLIVGGRAGATPQLWCNEPGTTRRPRKLERLRYSIVEECVRRVDPAPRYAVPDTAALGPVPNTRDELEDYLRRLDQVSRAMTIAQTAYAKALQDHEELGSRLEAYRARRWRPAWRRFPMRPGVQLARNALDERPSRMVLANSSSPSTRPTCNDPAPHAVHPATSSETT